MHGTEPGQLDVPGYATTNALFGGRLAKLALKTKKSGQIFPVACQEI
jgi:hypothetical protein